jgi:hypothetical protein
LGIGGRGILVLAALDPGPPSGGRLQLWRRTVKTRLCPAFKATSCRFRFGLPRIARLVQLLLLSLRRERMGNFVGQDAHQLWIVHGYVFGQLYHRTFRMCLRTQCLIFGAFSLLDPQSIHPRSEGSAECTERALLFAQTRQLSRQKSFTYAVFLTFLWSLLTRKPSSRELFGPFSITSPPRLRKRSFFLYNRRNGKRQMALHGGIPLAEPQQERCQVLMKLRP